MKVQIRRLEVNQVGALFAYLTGFLILLYSPIAVLKAIFDDMITVMEVLIGIPFALIIYVIISFVAGLIFAKLYNRAASKVGGLEMELEVVSDSSDSNSTKEPCPDI